MKTTLPEKTHKSKGGCLQPVVQCFYCDNALSSYSLSNLCPPCQKIEMKRLGDRRNFEREDFEFRKSWFAPVQMVTGDIMVHCIAHSAAIAWETFTLSGWDKKQRMEQGWRVKRIRITPDWTLND